MEVISYLLPALACVYGIWIGYCSIGWLRLQEVPDVRDHRPDTRVSVVVAARNEANNIVGCLDALMALDYPFDLLEVIVVDDHSDDNTWQLANEFVERKVPGPVVKVLRATNGTGKKQALTEGILAAGGQLVFTTDADCRTPPQWLRMMVRVYESHHPRMMLGTVRLEGKSAFQQWQSLEMAGLMGVTGGMAGWGSPSLANGANIGFERQAFLDVGGYGSHMDKASGDDVFLLGAFKKSYGKKSIRFVKDPRATVATHAIPGWSDFIQQRIRWASKIMAMKDFHIFFGAILVYFLHLFLLTTVLLSVIWPGMLFGWLMAMCIKCLFDFLFLYLVGSPPVRKWLWFKVLPAQCLNIVYVPWSGLLSFRGAYYWKGRRLSK
ncbi:MAG: glycosyltransferase [Flavobacteriales bacterium]|nr:glycosyltransferase [Flavobacteriales bacterium]MCB9448428.1 glycosyltransferase [Flavobacteriales bacterium]